VLVSRIYRSTFTACSFDFARFNGADVRGVSFTRCRAQYSTWPLATLENVKLDCDLRGAKLDLAQSDGIDFTGANLWAAVIPINCAFIVGNTFDERTAGCFLALMSRAKLPPGLREWVEEAIPKHSKRLVERIMRDQS
jgi:uncharacterized protein YjbI with pentapeptide repeats